MKLVWCPETASKAYLDAVAVRSLSGLGDREEASSVAVLIAAMAGGWKAQLVVEALVRGDSPATSLALAAALKHTRGRRVVIDEEEEGAEREGEGEGAVDFMVVDMSRRDAWRLVRGAKVGPRGMVVVCKNADVAEKRNMKGAVLLGRGMRLVRSAYLPIGRGVEILHVGVGKGPRLGGGGGRCNRWFKHVDQTTGEEHLFRK